MAMDKVHVIVNPFSARGKTGQQWDTIKEVIKHYFHEFKYVFTEKPRQATELARELLKEGTNLIIGVGGDGTLNEITNGFFHRESNQSINPEAALGIVPSGTGSDFIRFLRIPREFKQSIERIKHSSARQIDVGRISFQGTGPVAPVNQYFINVADFGLGAEVIKNLSTVPASKRGALSYYKGLLSTIRTYQSKKVRIVIDDSEEISDRFLIGAVANGRIFGGGMQIAPLAEPDDGFFDLVLIEDMTRFEIIYNSHYLYTGKLINHPKVIIKRARNIKVFPAEGETGTINIEYDGEVGQCVPAEFQVLERGVKLRV
jgi:diacylglycerol kinase (ATP)